MSLDSQRSLRFCPGWIHARFMVVGMELEQMFLRVYSASPDHYHSAIAPYSSASVSWVVRQPYWSITKSTLHKVVSEYLHDELLITGWWNLIKEMGLKRRTLAPRWQSWSTEKLSLYAGTVKVSNQVYVCMTMFIKYLIYIISAVLWWTLYAYFKI
jgi:hypothetical protein